MINRDGIIWLMNSPVGQLLRQHAQVLRRELPIYFAAAPELFEGGQRSSDPMDRVMVRGRIDLLVPTPRGLVIVDYKTDRVSAEQVESRADQYREQMRHYRDAVEAVTKKKVAAVHLAFLTPRIVYSLDGPLAESAQ